MSDWRVRLQGDKAELDCLVALLGGSSVVSIAVEDEDYYLRSSEFNSLTSPEAVRSQAATLLPIINGIGRLRFENFQTVQLEGLVASIDQQGNRSGQGQRAAPTSAVLARAGSPPPAALPAAFDSWIRQPQQAPEVETALRFFSYQPDWFNLWKVWEIIRDDVGRGAIVGQGWATPDEVDDFRESANTFQVSGEAARHALIHQSPSPSRTPMHLSKAEDFIRELLDKWLATK